LYLAIKSFCRYDKLTQTDTESKISEAMKSSGQPFSAGQLADIPKVDRKEIDKAMKALKDSGKIASPRRCYRTVS
jgi:hypothetical protein